MKPSFLSRLGRKLAPFVGGLTLLRAASAMAEPPGFQDADDTRWKTGAEVSLGPKQEGLDNFAQLRLAENTIVGPKFNLFLNVDQPDKASDIIDHGVRLSALSLETHGLELGLLKSPVRGWTAQGVTHSGGTRLMSGADPSAATDVADQAGVKFLYRVPFFEFGGSITRMVPGLSDTWGKKDGFPYVGRTVLARRDGPTDSNAPSVALRIDFLKATRLLHIDLGVESMELAPGSAVPVTEVSYGGHGFAQANLLGVIFLTASGEAERFKDRGGVPGPDQSLYTGVAMAEVRLPFPLLWAGGHAAAVINDNNGATTHAAEFGLAAMVMRMAKLDISAERADGPIRNRVRFDATFVLP